MTKIYIWKSSWSPFFFLRKFTQKSESPEIFRSCKNRRKRKKLHCLVFGQFNTFFQRRRRSTSPTHRKTYIETVCFFLRLDAPQKWWELWQKDGFPSTFLQIYGDFVVLEFLAFFQGFIWFYDVLCILLMQSGQQSLMEFADPSTSSPSQMWNFHI